MRWSGGGGESIVRLDSSQETVRLLMLGSVQRLNPHFHKMCTYMM